LPGDKRLSGTDVAIVKVAMLYEQTAEAEQIYKSAIEHESLFYAKGHEALRNAIA
jgi:hypothetical protein